MICPHCQQEIEDAILARHLAAKGGMKGGKASKRAITKEQQDKMQAARKKEK